MTLALDQALLRVAALQEEAMLALSTPVTANAFPYFFHVQGTFPYFINRAGDWTSEGDSEDFDADTHTIIMRLVIAHIDSGFEGDNDSDLYTYIPHIKTYFNERELLQSATYTSALDDLVRARCTDGNGLQVFRHTGATETVQVGTEWTLRLEFEEIIEQVYV